MRLVIDAEFNGLYEEADRMWCIVTKDRVTGQVNKYPPDGLQEGIRALEKADELIGNNIIDFDLRLIKKLYPYFKPRCLVLDTMLLSQLLQPDRAGGHSLEAAGERQGRLKPEHEDWSRFSPEMLHRCTEDVEINHVFYEELMNEAYEDVRGIEYHKVFL